MNLKLVLAVFSAISFASAQIEVDHVVFSEGEKPSLQEMWGELWPFQGINTFAHLDTEQCLLSRETNYDIALIGVPFDTATSYRSGARFGPRAIRAALQRQTSFRGYNQRAQFNPYLSWAKILDCGDIPVTPMDNTLAFKQMDMAFEELVLEHHSLANETLPPRYVALGGDHSVLLPHLRALHKVYGRINVIHFDAHLDTWKPDKYPSFWHTQQSELNHGSMLWRAFEEGLTSAHNVHAGLRTKLSGPADLEDDDEQNFVRINADDIWLDGVQSVVDRILDAIPEDTPTYISVDIDVLDPGFGSGTGTQEPGGWLPRELIHVLRKIDTLTIVGADVVEVNPDFDHAEITATNGAQVAFELITSMVKKGPVELPVHQADRTKVFASKPEARDLVGELVAKQQLLAQELAKIAMLKDELTNEIRRIQRV